MMKSLILTTSFLALAALPVWAQEAAETTTTTTVTAVTAVPATETTTTETTIAVKAPDVAEAEAPWELCPEPSMALTEVPSEMDELQADIDRYTLCLNRAELLLKLDDLKNQNRNAAPVDAMSLPLSPAPLTGQQAAELMGAPGTEMSPTAMTPLVQSDYGIRDIRGVGGMLMARLQSPSGEYEQVQIGDRLADGSEVTAITTSQVTIRRDGSVKRLEWHN